MPVGDFKRDIMNWPSRGVLGTSSVYSGAPPTDAEGLRRAVEGNARREAALLDARRRKGLHLAPVSIEGGASHGEVRPAAECDGGAEPHPLTPEAAGPGGEALGADQSHQPAG